MHRTLFTGHLKYELPFTIDPYMSVCERFSQQYFVRFSILVINIPLSLKLSPDGLLTWGNYNVVQSKYHSLIISRWFLKVRGQEHIRGYNVIQREAKRAGYRWPVLYSPDTIIWCANNFHLLTVRSAVSKVHRGKVIEKALCRQSKITGCCGWTNVAHACRRYRRYKD